MKLLGSMASRKMKIGAARGTAIKPRPFTAPVCQPLTLLAGDFERKEADDRREDRSRT